MSLICLYRVVCERKKRPVNEESFTIKITSKTVFVGTWNLIELRDEDESCGTSSTFSDWFRL